MTLPADVLGFGAVLIEVTRQCVVAAVVFGCFVAGRYPRIAAPNAPDSRVGRAASASAWLAAVLRIKVEDARRAGGVDGELYVRRVRMRLACFEVWVLLSAPLAFVYRRTERKRLDRRSWFCDVLQEDGCKDERERRSREPTPQVPRADVSDQERRGRPGRVRRRRAMGRARRRARGRVGISVEPFQLRFLERRTAPVFVPASTSSRRYSTAVIGNASVAFLRKHLPRRKTLLRVRRADVCF